MTALNVVAFFREISTPFGKSRTPLGLYKVAVAASLATTVFVASMYGESKVMINFAFCNGILLLPILFNENTVGIIGNRLPEA